MPQLILIRHGENEWNREHRFAGWADVGLTERGRQQMVDAGTLLARDKPGVDMAFTWLLTRRLFERLAHPGMDQRAGAVRSAKARADCAWPARHSAAQ